MRSLFAFSLSMGFGAVALACSGPVPRESVVRGTAALSSYPTAPTRVAARDELGNVVVGSVDAQGAFAISLPKGHTYRLGIETAAAAVPVVFPRASGALDTSFVLKTNGALLQLGQVRYLPAAPVSGFHVLSVQTPAPSASARAGADCIDCVNDDATVTCGGDVSTDEGESTVEPAGTAASALQADPRGELAVGDQNVPEEVDGCDDNVQQEGEH